ncbi:tetratricopeptide repeat protein [Micromonospora sp. NPDC049801]|uniref:tetratricopeptide repeat protein n=1 Tax=unclassified Micromonospora TaxID=2617518 RepID=UPI0033DA5A9C
MATAEEPHPSFQQVTSVAGFAYGVINADIHVFANGEPLYLLANWQPEPDADVDWLRQMPSRMLNARRAVVPFTGRDQELADLRQWRDSGPPRLSVRWLHGPGGQGKTRLAAQLAAESLSAGWKVVAAFHGPDADRPEPGSHDLALTGTAGLLLVVDYADRWLLSNLTWLLKNTLLHQVGVPTRILMIGRSLDTWPAISAILDNYRGHTSAQRLPDLPTDHARPTMFTAARDRFAAIYRHPRPSTILPSVPLDSPEFGLTLAVHMAALVAVDAAVSGERPPEGMDALTRYLLNREQLHWRRLYHDGLTGTGSGYRTPGDVMNHAVFTAALTGALDRTAGAELLEQLGVGPDVEQILRDHTVCYPPAEPNQPTVLEPLYPDRLTEDFLALTLPGHHTDYPAQDWAPRTATALLTARSQDDSTSSVLSRSIMFLAAAADRWPHVGSTLLYPLLRTHPDLAIRAGGTALTALATSRSVSIEVLESIEPLLPIERHINYDIAAAAVTSVLTAHRLAHTTDPAEQAVLQSKQVFRLARVGRQEEALAVAEEAVATWRRLAAADPDAHQENLATSLSDLGLRLSELGRGEQAVAPVQEAVAVFRRLAAADPGDYLPFLATSLNTVAAVLARLGRLAEALAVAEEAVATWRRLAEANPDAYLSDLANSLNNLGACLSELGRSGQALAPAKEAVAILGRLAEKKRGFYVSDFALSLNNLGNCLSALGRREQALAATQSAAGTYRVLAEANPDSYLPDLALSLNNLGLRLSALGRPEQALAPAEEAVAIRRRLAETNPNVHLPHLADSLNNLGAYLFELGRPEQALAPTEEAVAIGRRLAETNPDVHLPDLADSLTNLGAHLSALGRPEQALAPTEEAVAIGRRLAETNPDAYRPHLAASLTNLGTCLSALGRPEQALAAAEAAAVIHRRLAEVNPDVYLADLATSLTSVGSILFALGRRERAIAPAEEIVAVRRQLAETNRDTHLPDLAMSLWTYATVCADAKQNLPEALKAITEATQLYGSLAKRMPQKFAGQALSAYRTLADVLEGVGRRDEANGLRQQLDRITIRTKD